jgi:hypothetical protein
MRISFKMIEASRSGAPAKFQLLPEMDLMLAVLEDAIACYMNHLKPKSISGKTIFNDAERWFFDDAGDWIFSFASICDAVGLDADYLRQGLRDAKNRTIRHRPLALREVRHGYAAQPARIH